LPPDFEQQLGRHEMAPGGGWEYPAFWILTMIAIALIGDGAWATTPTMSLAARPRMSLAK
jgi:hypothetical protein